MTKNELRNGMLVQCRNGDWYLVSKDVRVNYEYKDTFMKLKGSWLDMDKYDNSMIFNGDDEFDVIKVIEAEFFGNVVTGLQQGINPEKLKNVKVLWTRSNSKVTEVESLIAELQEQLKAAQDKLEALR